MKRANPSKWMCMRSTADIPLKWDDIRTLIINKLIMMTTLKYNIKEFSIKYVKHVDDSLQVENPLFLEGDGIWKVQIKMSTGGVVGNLYFNGKQFIPEKSDTKEVIRSNVQFRKKMHDLYSILEEVEREHKHKFLKYILPIIEGTLILSHLICAGFPLGGELKLLYPRNTYVRADKSISMKFEDALDEEKSIDDNFKYKISLREMDGNVVWGPHEITKKIKEDDTRMRNSKRYIIIEHLLEYKNFIPNKKYRWTVETSQDIKSADFEVLDNTSAEFLNQVEQELKDSELNIGSAFILGALYESRGLYDDALQKYEFVASQDPLNVIAGQQISTVYAKKASRSFFKEVDIENISSRDIQKDDVDLAHEADRWYNNVEEIKKGVYKNEKHK